jgi:glycosyltransferase involved in cell wall biosynthesis
MVERRLLTIGHSYVVANNRRLAHEMAVQGNGRWRVTVVSPEHFRGDMREIALEPIAGEASVVRRAAMRFDRNPHLMWYGNARRILSGDWDLVHCWEEPFVLAAAQIARAAPPRARFVVSTFQNIQKAYPWPLSAFERNVLTRADGWIAFGETVHETMVKHADQYRQKPSRVISPGVDTSAFVPDPAAGRRIRQRLGWSDEARVVGYVGRFVPEKGLAILTAALAASNASWCALLVGAGPLEGDLHTFAASFPDRVQVVTGIPHGEIPQWLNAMDILCAPSLTTGRWREQFGRMLIEAMASGVPVIGSDSGEIPYVLGDTGLLVPEGDAGAWTHAIDLLLGDDEMRTRLAARGRERALERFAWPVVARQHLEFFESLINDGPNGAN